MVGGSKVLLLASLALMAIGGRVSDDEDLEEKDEGEQAVGQHVIPGVVGSLFVVSLAESVCAGPSSVYTYMMNLAGALLDCSTKGFDDTCFANIGAVSNCGALLTRGAQGLASIWSAFCWLAGAIVGTVWRTEEHIPEVCSNRTSELFRAELREATPIVEDVLRRQADTPTCSAGDVQSPPPGFHFCAEGEDLNNPIGGPCWPAPQGEGDKWGLWTDNASSPSAQSLLDLHSVVKRRRGRRMKSSSVLTMTALFAWFQFELLCGGFHSLYTYAANFLGTLLECLQGEFDSGCFLGLVGVSNCGAFLNNGVKHVKAVWDFRGHISETLQHIVGKMKARNRDEQKPETFTALYEAQLDNASAKVMEVLAAKAGFDSPQGASVEPPPPGFHACEEGETDYSACWPFPREGADPWEVLPTTTGAPGWLW